jgi:hypothetical protein
MAAIYLGLDQSGATLLPPIRWVNGGSPEFPIDYSKRAEKATMLGGSQRFHPKSEQPRRWNLQWEMLTLAEMADFETLRGYNQELQFQNNWEDATWREVVITAFDRDPVVNLGPTTCRWNLSITLEEVV